MDSIMCSTRKRCALPVADHSLADQQQGRARRGSGDAPGDGGSGHQPGFGTGPRLFKILEDGRRLNEVFAIDLQCRRQALRVECKVARLFE